MGLLDVDETTGGVESLDVGEAAGVGLLEETTGGVESLDVGEATAEAGLLDVEETTVGVESVDVGEATAGVALFVVEDESTGVALDDDVPRTGLALIAFGCAPPNNCERVSVELLENWNELITLLLP